MKKLDYSKVEAHITEWMIDYLKNSKQKGWVIGVSGGVDSATVSTLCAITKFPVLCLSMPIHQAKDQLKRANEHIAWLKENYPNVYSLEVDLTEEYDALIRKYIQSNYPPVFPVFMENAKLTEANTRSRLRMNTLYYYNGIYQFLVAGTGNKVEDMGVGFFTKYGDGGVDISPIGDLMKSEVRALGLYMGVSDEIIEAKPTDGLWDDGRGDEDQIGASYDELEWAMKECEKHQCNTFNDILRSNNILLKTQKENNIDLGCKLYEDRELKVLKIYLERHHSNAHKMNPIPICDISNLRK